MPSVDVYPSTPPQEKDPGILACDAARDDFNDANVNGGPGGVATVTTYAYRSNDTQVRFTTNVEGDALKDFLEEQFSGYNVVEVEE